MNNEGNNDQSWKAILIVGGIAAVLALIFIILGRSRDQVQDVQPAAQSISAASGDDPKSAPAGPGRPAPAN